jgi:Glu-tRNA(Gln) amidotransferase subunit E-like FAD-binding protein
MAEKEIALLKDQLARLDEKKFDFDAWKNHTLIFLERIFGKDNSKLILIKELHYDYSSWNLRDTAAAGKTKDKDPVKMQAREILTATITELEKLGLPQNKLETEKIWVLLKDELTGKQAKEIEVILNSDDSNKIENISKTLEKLGAENLSRVIAKLLIN